MKLFDFFNKKKTTQKKLKKPLNIDIEKNIIIDENGKIDYSVEKNMEIDKGLYCGIGIELTKQTKKLQKIIIPWSDLNSHKLTTGTTRQGKSRAMVADFRQQILRGDNVIIGEPKGSEGQEIYSYALSAAMAANREKDLKYLSPFYHEDSIKFNALYRLKDDQRASLVASIIEAQDPFYANIAKSIVLCSTIAIRFIEEVDKLVNPYDYIIMEKIEYAKIRTAETNKINKYIWDDYYVNDIHGVKADIIKDLKEGKDEDEIAKIDIAYKRTKLRYQNASINEVVPLSTFLTFRDLAQFENLVKMEILKQEVESRRALLDSLEKEKIKNYDEIVSLGIEALNELERILLRPQEYFSKVSTTYSTLMSDLITGDVGKILNDSKINILIDDMASSKRGLILVVQSFPLIYKNAADAIGKILFAMLSMVAGYVGASGTLMSKRINVNIDEAGEILIPVIKNLSNKGGGLGFSLYLYTQSLADIEETLGPEGARILLDNINNKMSFRGNDNVSMAMITEIMGMKKDVSITNNASDKRDTRIMTRADEVEIAPSFILQKLKARKYVAKFGDKVYIATAANQPDSFFKIIMPIKSLETLSNESDKKLEDIDRLMI